MGMEDVGIDMLMDAMDAAEEADGGMKVDEVYSQPKELFAVKALMPTLMQHIPQQTIVVLGVLMGANVGLMLAVKFGCYA